MKKIAVFTIVSKNYLAYARTLFYSIANIHPEYQLYLCLADQVDDYFDAKSEPFNVIQADKIAIPNFEDMTLRYDIMEFNTAVKPFMFRWLFDNLDLDTVIYLDPDILVYSRFECLESVLNSGPSVVLIPHITVPLEDAKTPNDYHMLQSGVFNLGFMAANRCKETIDYIDWWGRRLITQCASDVSNNLFTDQKWCDLAPCFLDNLKVFKDPSYNVAYWNLSERKVQYDPQNGWQVNGKPLAFFHFSGVNTDDKHMVSKHQNRFEWDDIKSCQTLFTDYINGLNTNGWTETRKWPYAYNVISKNMNMSPIIRRLYREQNPDSIEIERSRLEEYIVDLCNQPATNPIGKKNVCLSKLMVLIYKLRPDVQAIFSLSSSEGQHQFIGWFESAGEREYGLSPSVTYLDCIKKPHIHRIIKKKW